MEDGAGVERRVFGQIHDKLHADRPVADVMGIRQTELRVELLANRADPAAKCLRKIGACEGARPHGHGAEGNLLPLANIR